MKRFGWVAISVMAMACTAFGEGSADSFSQIENAEQFKKAIAELPPEVAADPFVKEAINSSADVPTKAERLSTLLRSRHEALQIPDEVNAEEASKSADDLLNNPLYRDPGPDTGDAGWFERAMQNLLEHVPEFDLAQPEYQPRPPHPLLIILLYIFGGVLAIAILAALGYLIYLLATFLFTRGKAVKSPARGGILESDEPILPSDEWIAMAEGLASQGRYREAFRCVYLACLMRYDEAGIAELVPTQTNWEHSRRIGEAKFREATLRFDHVWYGYAQCGEEELTWIKTYAEELRSLKGRSAA